MSDNPAREVEQFAHQVPTKVIGGQGALQRLTEEVSGWPRSCLLVCGRRFARLSGVLERLTAMLTAQRLEAAVFDGVEPNPSVETVLEGVERARAARCRWVLAVGGGSAIDAAKAIALKTVNQGKLQDFAGNMRPENCPLPVVAVPTTAGTGSEVTQYAVLTDTRAVDKFGIALPELFPRLAILDPELSLSLPEAVTVDSGLDALCHAVEALFSRQRSPFSDLAAERAIRLILDNLAPLRSEPQDVHRRGEMLLAACLAGQAIADTGTLLPHAMSYPVTIRFGIAHGRATALLLPVVVERLAALKPERAALVGRLLGDESDPPAALRHFIESLGVAPRLGAYGFQEDACELLAGQAAGKKHLAKTPGQWSREQIEAIYRAAY